MAKISCKENVKNNEITSARSPLDLVCVVDRSGSMSGNNKWNILVETMNDLLDLLEDFDRLSIVSFDSIAKREFNLIRMNEKGKNTVR